MDYSFLRFLDNFNSAKDLYNCKLSDFNYDDQIHLKPGEDYSVITNVPNGIAFNNLYKAYLVDCDNTILQDVTSNVLIEEFINSKTGLSQLKLELFNIVAEYYTDLVYLRVDHDIVGGKSYWTNPFLISNYDVDETTKFRFKHDSYLDGTDYSVARIYQSIRLKCYKEKNSFISTKQSYTTTEGLVLASELIKSKQYNIIFDRLNDFIYDRMQYLLSHDTIYVNDIRVTDKQTFENADKFSNTTNVSSNKFKLFVDEEDVYSHGYQIAETFNAVLFKPANSYSTSIPGFSAYLLANNISVKFNKVITSLEPNFRYRLYEDGVEVVNSTNATFTGDTLLLTDLQSYTYGAHVYCITIEQNSVKSNIELWNGVVYNAWKFTINSGFYNKIYYNELKYNTD